MTFQPTHRVPEGGLSAWDVPDPDRAPVAQLESGLPVEVVQVQGGWTQLRCSNGWAAWADGSRLVVGAAVASSRSPTAMTMPTTTDGRTALAVGVGVVLFSFLPWVSIVGGGDSLSRTAWKLPAAVLVNREADPDGIKLALLLVALGGITAGLSLYEPTSTVARWAGVPILGVTLLYVIQLSRVPGIGPADVGLGAWLTGLAGIVCLTFPALAAASRADGAPSAGWPTMPATAATAATPAVVPMEPPPHSPATSSTSGGGPSGDAPVWTPTHRVSASGAQCYARPDVGAITAARLDPGLRIAVIEETMGWAHIRCSNGWTAWIDGRELELMP